MCKRTYTQATLPFGKAHKTATSSPALPEPSEEQRQIVDSLRAGNCVHCEALAGTGKTTTCLLAIHTLCDLHALVLTFGKVLTDDCKERIGSHGLAGHARAATFHSVFGQQLSGHISVSNDDKLTDLLVEWRRCSERRPRRLTEGLIILDEMQDLCPLIFESLEYILPNDALILVLGDHRQLVHDWKEGLNKATDVYLKQAPKLLGRYSGGRTWDARKLTLSYRLTPSVAAFVNAVWSTDIRAANTTSANLPVEYWHLRAYDTNTLAKRIAEVIEDARRQGLRMQDVWILAQSVEGSKNGNQTPLEAVLNQLQQIEDERGRRKYNFLITSQKDRESGGADLLDNKVRVSTFCASKGGEARVVFVWGLSMYDRTKAAENLNQVCVALSRSSCRLIVLHELGDAKPVDYFPPLCRATVKELCERQVVTMVDALPHDTQVVDSVKKRDTLWASDVARYFSPDTRRRLTRAFVWQHDEWEDGRGLIEVSTCRQFHTGALRTTETLGHIYGIALPLALEERRTGAIGGVEAVLFPIRIVSKHNYRWEDVQRILQDESYNIDPSDQLQRRLQIEYGKIANGGSSIKGPCLIDLLRGCRLRRLDNGRPLGVCDELTYDIFFERHVQRLRHVYTEGTKEMPCRYMLLANACNVYGGAHSDYHQVGFELEGYKAWVQEEPFLRALDRLDAMTDDGPVDFEHQVEVAFAQPVQHGNRLYVGIGARVDCTGKDVVYENKFCRDKISEEHEMQALVGACLVALERKRSVRCVVNGFCRGEQATTHVTPEAARELLRGVRDAYGGT